MSNTKLPSNSQQFFFQHSRVWTKLVVQLLKPFGASKALSSKYCWGSESLNNSGSHIDASHSRQPLVKGERLVRYEVNAVMPDACKQAGLQKTCVAKLVSATRTWICLSPAVGR